ncbi:MAG TPA: thrombospondin type 3 repeat-containing protein [Candidatus Deferrimicrobium sp.]|nr:thrombospondin type 3 repeat-containing protein [Candidatus Deferrimicrobium sp.]
MISRRANAWPALLMRVILTLTFSVLAYGGAEAAMPEPQKIVVPLAAQVSWDDLVALDAQPRTEISEAGRVAPFMPLSTRELPSLVSPPAPADVLWTPATEISMVKPPIVASFQALADNNTTIPPDTHGAAGRNHVMTMLNSQVRVQTRTGIILSTVSLVSFWSPVGSSDVFDPRIVYDAGSNRWMATCEADRRSPASSMLFAISATDNPTGTWNFYRIDADPANINWADFPDIGHNMTWIGLTSNMYTFADIWSGPALWVIDKLTALAGGPLTVTSFPPGSDAFGGFSGATLRVCRTYGPEPKLYIADHNWKLGSTHVLRLTEITGTGPAPVWSATSGTGTGYPGTGWFYATYSFDWGAIDAPQLGTATRVDAGDSRMQNAVFRNGRIWCTHAGGFPDGAPDRTIVLWYEIDPTAMPSPIVQSGVFDGGVDVHYFFPSIAVNAANDVLLGFSRSDATIYVEGVYTGRMSSDPLGTMASISVLKLGEDSYVKDFGSGVVRWGDYSATMVDPVDDMAFWTIQEYAAFDVGPSPSQDRWGTWWGRATFDSDGDAIPDSVDNCPQAINPGQGDGDADGLGDSCDVCTDTDGDGFGNPGFPKNTCGLDNCPATVNPSQADANGDGIGDACCCSLERGNVDGIVGPAGPIDVADLTYLVTFLFSGGTTPPCPDEGNVDGIVGPGGPVDVSDLTYLVDYLFGTPPGPPPPACP